MADREPPGDTSVADATRDDAQPPWLPQALKDGRNQLIVAIVVGGVALTFVLWLIGRLGNALCANANGAASAVVKAAMLSFSAARRFNGNSRVTAL